MRKDKNLAIKLRCQNKSYNEINKILGVPKSTLAGWFKNDLNSQKIKTVLVERVKRLSSERFKKLSAVQSLKWEQWRNEARNEAVRQFPQLCKNPQFIAGLMLYWGEGDSKVANPVRLANTDPRMIKLYTRFLSEALCVPKEKIRGSIVLYPDLSSEKCLNYWSKITDIPQTQFYKPQFIKGHHPTKRLSNGICTVVCNSRQLKEKILVWVDLLSKKL